MIIATNDDNSTAANTPTQTVNSTTSSSTRPSEGRKARRRIAQVTSTPAGNTDAPSSGPTGATAEARSATKTDTVLHLLRRVEGASLSEISTETGWQAHSVRGFLSGTVRKKHALNLVSVITGDGVRRYRIGEAAASVEPAQPIDLPAFGSFRGTGQVEQADATQGA
jgi:hypothetical protein